MRVKEGLATGAERGEILKYGVPALWVHPHGGFIQQQYLRVVQEGGRQVEAAFHPAAESPGLVCRAFRQADNFQRLGNPFSQNRRVEVIKGAKESQVVMRGQIVVESQFLRHEAKLVFQRVSIPRQTRAPRPILGRCRA